MRLILGAVLLLPLAAGPQETVQEQFTKRAARLWSLQPVTRPAVPSGASNPIDAFIVADYKSKGLLPTGKADKLNPAAACLLRSHRHPSHDRRTGRLSLGSISERLRKGREPAVI